MSLLPAPEWREDFCAGRANPVKVRARVAATQRIKREARGSNIPEVKQPKPEHVCSGCGKPIQDRSANCADCAVDGATERLVDAARIGRVAARRPDARAKHVTSRRRHAQACSEWDESMQPAWLMSEVFSQRIQPQLANIPTSAIRSRIGVSHWYAGRIRQGYCPHPRALAVAGGTRWDFSGSVTARDCRAEVSLLPNLG